MKYMAEQMDRLIESGVSEFERMSEEIAKLKEERDIALSMLAGWCVAVDVNGAGWDYWDEYYKDAMYRPGPLRELLDSAIADARKLCGMR